MNTNRTVVAPNGATAIVSLFHRHLACTYWTSESGMDRMAVVFGTETKAELESRLPYWGNTPGQTWFFIDLDEELPLINERGNPTDEAIEILKELGCQR